DELLHRPHGHRGVHSEYRAQLRERRYSREIAQRVVLQLLVQVVAGYMGGDGLYEKGVAVGLALRRDGGAGRAPRARAVFDDELLAHLVRELGQHDARRDVVRPAWGKRNDHAYGLGGISLRPDDAGGAQHAGDDSKHSNWSHALPPRRLCALVRQADRLKIKRHMRIRCWRVSFYRSGRTSAILMICPQTFNSAAISRANSSGRPGAGSAPS